VDGDVQQLDGGGGEVCVDDDAVVSAKL